MATPPPPGSRPAAIGGGVRNLRAMFENGGSPVASTRAFPSREVSPSPKPLGKVRTSFVAVGGKEGQMAVGLQKIPTDGDGSTEAASAALEGKKPDPPVEEPRINLNILNTPVLTNGKKQEAEKEPMKPVALPKMETPKVEKPVVNPEPTPIKVEKKEPEKVARKEEPKPKEKEKEKEKLKVKPKPVDKEEPKPKKVENTKPIPAKVEVSKPIEKKTKAPTAKNLTVPTIRNTRAASPVGVPLVPKNPVPRAARAWTPVSATTKKPLVPKQLAPRVESTKRQPSLSTSQQRPNATPIPHKVDPKPQPREATKPADLKGTAFGPTAAWIAKHADPSSMKSPARAPSAAGNSRPDEQPVKQVRRQNSINFDRSKTMARYPRRPATSAANRPTESIVKVLPPPSTEFLERMMRPTQSSMGKVQERKVDTIIYPPLRTGSAMSRRLSQSPPRSAKEWKSRRIISHEYSDSDTSVTKIVEHVETPKVAPLVETTQELASTPEAETEDEEQGYEEVSVIIEDEDDRDEAKDVAAASAPVLLNINTINTDQSFDNDVEGHTPTTTTSSSTLVHEGEAPENVLITDAPKG